MTLSIAPASDGLARRPFSVADLERMLASGVIGEDENLELIDGDLVPMAAKHHAHERVKSALILAIAAALPEELWLGVESSFRLSEWTLVEPDIAVYARGLRLEEVEGADILLAVEVADTSLALDRGPKAQLYARHGVRELWVIDVNERVTWVHRGPTASGWSSLEEVGSDRALRPQAPLLSRLAFRLAAVG